MKYGTEKKLIAEGQFVNFVSRGGWEYAERRNMTGIVVLIPVTGERELILVEQFRPPVGCAVIELPAGLAGDLPEAQDENLEMAAERELIEETGYRPGVLSLVAKGPPSPGITDEVMNIFLATRLERVGEGGGDASEAITVHKVPLDSAQSWLQERAAMGVMIDPKVFMGLYFAQASNRKHA